MTEVSDLKKGDRVRVAFEGEVTDAVEGQADYATVRVGAASSRGRRYQTLHSAPNRKWWESLEVIVPTEPLALGAVVEVRDGLGGPLRYIRISGGEPDAYAWTVVRRADRIAYFQASRRRWSDLRSPRVISTGVTE